MFGLFVFELLYPRAAICAELSLGRLPSPSLKSFSTYQAELYFHQRVLTVLSSVVENLKSVVEEWKRKPGKLQTRLAVQHLGVQLAGPSLLSQ
jgi:hypothetical protein